jgi:hypothetical protein
MFRRFVGRLFGPLGLSVALLGGFLVGPALSPKPVEAQVQLPAAVVVPNPVTVASTANLYAAGLSSAGGIGTLPPAVTVTSGKVLNVATSGSVSCCSGNYLSSGDGSPFPGGVTARGGLSDVSGRIMVLIGVFLGPGPAAGASPARSSTIDADFLVATPVLQQVFHVGDGRPV